MTPHVRPVGWHLINGPGPRASMQTPGIPDLYVRSEKWGVRLWCEVKTATGKPSPAQLAWHAMERSVGGDVVIVRSVDERDSRTPRTWGADPVRTQEKAR